MRPSFVISLLLLSLFLTKAQGIRLEKGSFASQQHKQHDQQRNLLNRINGANKEAILCEDEQYCTGKIKIRKLVTSSTSTTHDISKMSTQMKPWNFFLSPIYDLYTLLHGQNVKNGGNEAQAPEIGNSRNYKVNGEEKEILVNKQQVLSHENYPDLVDIADMDYSPAKKNPPIHN
ncbi:hypothetical protein CR513_02332 [Mucuna pruriens]|uniref:Uncharacterized protein n=1 Tax=Mucuna pruriens TaxID=157652 RepID=A0A371ICT9_MUCPR|nr:hypothetical protein CR513_02332 [Mucuna pruriens]